MSNNRDTTIHNIRTLVCDNVRHFRHTMVTSPVSTGRIGLYATSRKTNSLLKWSDLYTAAKTGNCLLKISLLMSVTLDRTSASLV